SAPLARGRGFSRPQHGARWSYFVDVLAAGGPHTNDNPHKTVPIPHCLRADGGTLCQCDRTGLLAADDVCPRCRMAGHNQTSTLPAQATALCPKGLEAASLPIVVASTA